MYELWNALEKARQYRWVDLSHSLNNDSPYWAGIPDGSVELSKTVYDWGNEMLDCLIQTFKFPGQFGTHIDFPGHFVPEGQLSQAYGVQQLVFPLCVLDVTEKSKKMSTTPSPCRIFWTTRPSMVLFRTVILWPCAPNGAGAGPT